MSQVFFGAPEDFAVMPQEDVATIPPVAPAGVVPPPPDSNRVLPPGFFGETGGGDTGGGDTGGDDDTDEDMGPDAATLFAQQQAAQRRENAFAIINTFLARAGLSGLETSVRDLLAQGIEDSASILYRLRDTEQFKTRFKANIARAKAGLPELDPATYIGLEQSYRETLRANELPPEFYDSPDDFAKLIEGDVSVAELQSRVQDGYRKVIDADPEVKRQMQELYNVSEKQLAAYFIDPDRGLSALKRAAQSAQISARGRELAGLQLTREQAEALEARGISPEEAQRQFAERGRLAGLYQPLYGEQGLTAEQELGATFGFDVQAQQELERRRAQRVGEFQAGGQFARTTGATSGTIETGVGTAQ